MYEIRDGRYYFILIDFDMAVYLGNGKKRGEAGNGSLSATSKNRTGTLPFMACELVTTSYCFIQVCWFAELFDYFC